MALREDELDEPYEDEIDYLDDVWYLYDYDDDFPVWYHFTG